MPRITYITASGDEFVAEAADGANLMQTALDHNVPGILGECGGCCACATCHLFVTEEWIGRVPPSSVSEIALLSGRDDVVPTSRLGCQIIVEPTLDGLIVRLPESQY